MNTRKALIYGQVGFFVLMAICFVLEPNQQAIDDGISYFGIHSRTLIPDIAAFLVSGFFIWLASNNLLKRGYTHIAHQLRLIVILMPGVLLSPYVINNIIYGLHVAISSTIFILELLLAIFMYWNYQKDRTNLALITIQVFGGTIALFSLNDWLRCELWGQMLFQLAFSILIIRIVSNLPKTSQINRPAEV